MAGQVDSAAVCTVPAFFLGRLTTRSDLCASSVAAFAYGQTSMLQAQKSLQQQHVQAKQVARKAGVQQNCLVHCYNTACTI